MSHSRPVGFLERLAYSMGGVANNYMNNLLPLLALPIFSVGLGVDAWKVGLALAVPRIWDAVTDPLIGHLSDSAKTRWGRRRPFLFVGSIAVMFTYGLLWLATPEWSTDAIFWWFLGLSMLYYTATTVFSIPYIAIAYEIATDSKERAKLMTFRSVVSSIFGLGFPWVYAMCFWEWGALLGPGGLFTRLSALVVSPDGHQLAPPGYQIVGVLLAALMALAGLCTLYCKENPRAVPTQRKEFGRSFLLAFRNKAFVFLCGGLIFSMLGIFLVMPLATYVNIYHLFEGNQKAAASMLAKVGTVQTACGVPMVMICGYLVARLGAARMMKIFLGLTALSFGIKYWTYTPDFPWLQVIPLLIWQFSWSGTMLAFNVMLGDVTDYDDYMTGERREGMYGAINQFLTKLVIALSTALSGVLLSASGIVAGAAEQTERAIWLMRVEFSFVPFVIVLLACISFFFYPLTDAESIRIREELARRKGLMPRAHERDG